MAAKKGNLYALGCTTSGRPPMYKTPEELDAKILEYFEWCLGEFETRTEEVQRRRKNADTGKMEMKTETKTTVDTIREPERPTWTKLAIFLGFESRKSLHDYSLKEEFSYSIKKALLIIESIYEDGLTGSAVAGVIFALKNLGWKDQQDINHSGKVDTGEDLTALSDEELKARIAKLKKQKQAQ